MLRSQFAGISGMRVEQTALDVAANNIANSNTIGYKSQSTQFQDSLSQSLTASSAPSQIRGGSNPAQVGLGVQVAGITTNFQQGSNSVTGVGTDLMINGDGFFVLQDGTNQYYTRAGSFTFDANGNLVAPDGKYVMGYRAIDYSTDTAPSASFTYANLGETNNTWTPMSVTDSALILSDDGGTSKYTINIGAATTESQVVSLINNVLGGITAPSTGSVIPVGGLTERAFINDSGKIAFTTIDGSTPTMTVVQDPTDPTKNVDATIAYQQAPGDFTISLNDGTPIHVSLSGIPTSPTAGVFTVNGQSYPTYLDAVAGTIQIALNKGDTTNPPTAGYSVTLGDGTTNPANSFVVTSVNPPATPTINTLHITGTGVTDPFATGPNVTPVGGTTPTEFGFTVQDLGVLQSQGLSWNTLGVSAPSDTLPPDVAITIDGGQPIHIDLSGTTHFGISVDDPNSVMQAVSQALSQAPTASNAGDWTVTLAPAGVGLALVGPPGSSYIDATGISRPHTATITSVSDSAVQMGTFTNGTTDNAVYSNQLVRVNLGANITGNPNFPTGAQLQSYTIGPDGVVTGTYNDGSKLPIAKIAMANFINPAGLSKVGDTQFAASSNSGNAIVSTAGAIVPGVGQNGVFAVGSLEQSNVDLATEFTNMILAQRGFEANSKVITTSDDVLSALVNLIR